MLYPLLATYWSELMTGPLNPVLRKRVLAWLSSAIDDELARRRHGELFEQLYRHLYAADEILQSLWQAGPHEWEDLDQEDEALRWARQYLERKLAAVGAALCSIKDLDMAIYELRSAMDSAVDLDSRTCQKKSHGDTGTSPLFERLVCKLLDETNGQLGFDRNTHGGSLVDVLNQLRPHIRRLIAEPLDMNDVFPSRFPAGLLFRIVREWKSRPHRKKKPMLHVIK